MLVDRTSSPRTNHIYHNTSRPSLAHSNQNIRWHHLEINWLDYSPTCIIKPIKHISPHRWNNRSSCTMKISDPIQLAQRTFPDLIIHGTGSPYYTYQNHLLQYSIYLSTLVKLKIISQKSKTGNTFVRQTRYGRCTCTEPHLDPELKITSDACML
ncbi:hypothetical protein ASPTUDRAFT_790823 [Aspergillus tubingensis CBS 134.48]|uniref:Uncharacterized protein n=1 Tax=Aspergillus tubingensis (strain CBS 134.48) TaxID=767770 RepID=A0A1L9MVM6_ASPTC|nr:hypothetical protein ASPTUDRAFT_790823 [Aspergillus tubingensis CBS 134.48]